MRVRICTNLVRVYSIMLKVNVHFSWRRTLILFNLIRVSWRSLLTNWIIYCTHLCVCLDTQDVIIIYIKCNHTKFIISFLDSSFNVILTIPNLGCWFFFIFFFFQLFKTKNIIFWRQLFIKFMKLILSSNLWNDILKLLFIKRSLNY